MKNLKVLIACEESGTVRDAFQKRGHYAVSVDILPTRIPGNHHQGDIFHFLHSPLTMYWDLIIGFPPCTYLCNSGVRWLYNADGSKNEDRWQKMEMGAYFFKSLLHSNCDRIAIENPIMHKYAKEIIVENQSQVIQPWQFGHGETKATCLWLKGLPKLEPTNIVDGREQRIWKMGPGENRQRERSKTFPGIAEAMADQWGNYLKEKLNNPSV